MAKKRNPPEKALARADPKPQSADILLAELRGLIESARSGIAQAVNSAQALLYWQVGQRVLTEILGNQRASYCDEIVATVSRQLTAEYGRRFAEKSFRRMIQFAGSFPDREIVAALSRQLSWSHFVEVIPLADESWRGVGGRMGWVAPHSI